MYTITWQGAVVPWPSSSHFSLRPQITCVPGTQHLKKCCPSATHSRGRNEHTALSRGQDGQAEPAPDYEWKSCREHRDPSSTSPVQFPYTQRGIFFCYGNAFPTDVVSREVMNILKTTAEIKFPIIFPRSVTNKAGNSDWVRKKYWSTVLLLLFNKKKKQQCNRVSHVMNNSHNGS